MRENEIKQDGEYQNTNQEALQQNSIHKKQRENYRIIWQVVELSILGQVLFVGGISVVSYVILIWQQSAPPLTDWLIAMLITCGTSFINFAIFTESILILIPILNIIRLILILAAIVLYCQEKRSL